MPGVPPDPHHRPSSLAIWSALLAVYLIWGSTYLAIRYAVETAPPFLMAGVRFAISGAFLYGVRRRLGDPAPKRHEWISAAIIGGFLLVGGNGGVVWAEQVVPSAVTALLVATVPLWMTLIDAIRPNGIPPEPKQIAGILAGFCGVVLLLVSAASELPAVNLASAAVVVFASVSWAAGSLYARSARIPASPLLATGMEMISGSVALLAIAFSSGEWNEFHASAISLHSALALLYLTVVGSAAFVAYVWLLRVAPTPLVGTYAYVNPLVAVLLGYFLAHEALTSRILLAAGLIVGSVALVSITRSSARAPSAQNSR